MSEQPDNPLLGVWRLVDVQQNGASHEYDQIGMEIEFTDRWMFTRHRSSRGKNRYEVDASREPGEFATWLPPNFPPVLGIFRLVGDELMICRGVDSKVRPKSFMEHRTYEFTFVYHRASANTADADQQYKAARHRDIQREGRRWKRMQLTGSRRVGGAASTKPDASG